MIKELFDEIEHHAVLRGHVKLVKAARKEYEDMLTALKLMKGAPADRLKYLNDHDINFNIQADSPDAEWRKRIIQHLCGWINDNSADTDFTLDDIHKYTHRTTLYGNDKD